MAADFLLLKRYPQAEHLRFRHYGWHRPAMTFGYSQKIEFIRSQLPKDERVELCRRVTGGGLVDHRNDWTYALVIPRGHSLYDQPAPHSYRTIHETLASCLRALGEDVEVKEACEPVEGACATGPTICFMRAEKYDVVRKDGRKVAGAAQKRTKEGLLFQGSLDRGACEHALDELLERFPRDLAQSLGCTFTEAPWPEYAEGEWEGLTEQYSSAEWVESR